MRGACNNAAFFGWSALQLRGPEKLPRTGTDPDKDPKGQDGRLQVHLRGSPDMVLPDRVTPPGR